MKISLFIIRGITCLLVFSIYNSCHPDYAPTKVKVAEDSLSAHIKDLVNHNRWKKAIVISGNYIKRSHENRDQRGVVFGYIQIGNIYSLHDNYTEAITFLNKANAEKAQLNEPDLDTRLYSNYAIVYEFLGLQDKAMQYQDKAFISAGKIADSAIRARAVCYLSSVKAEFYEDRKKYDSMLLYLHSCFTMNPEPNASARIAMYFLSYSISLDSARYYLQKADSLYGKGNYPPYYKGAIDMFWGDLHLKKKEYDAAIACYLNAADRFRQEGRIGNLRRCYDFLYQAYKEKGDMGKSREYLEKSTALSDSINNAKETPLAISVNEIEEEYERQYNKGKLKVLWMMAGIFSLSLIIILLYIRYSRRKQKHTSALLAQKEEETSLLQKRVNSSFDELVELATQNAPNFYTRFKEVYPDWHKKIGDINADMTFTELTLCAYIYLDFQTKEIAEFTCKSVRTIQNGKYNIRKKLKLASDIDIYMWLKNLS